MLYQKICKWIIYQNRNLFPTVLKVGKSKIKAPVGSVSGDGCSLLLRWALNGLLSHSGRWKDQRSLAVSLHYFHALMS
jgi:hypothetical protein